jgi:asparagine synthase (glutamine-hydrolysing)
MCGLFLEIDLRGHRWSPQLKAATAKDLSIRGPDALHTVVEGEYRLSHARLSILDLMSGNQPMFNADKSRVVLFNGEIFNHGELRDKYGRTQFRTRSDTEVLLQIEDICSPEQFLGSLRGMFAFALVDFRQGLTLIARDQFGKKPLFYGEWDGVWYASSRLQTILQEAHSQPPLNSMSVAYYSDLGYIPSPFSMVSPIKKLLPGEWKVIDRNGKCVKKGMVSTVVSASLCDAAPALGNDQFESYLKKSIDRRLESDVPLGYLLSNGLDSSTIIHQAAHESVDKVSMNIFTFEQEGPLNEAEGAKAFAKSLGLNVNSISFSSGINDFQDILQRLDEPFADLSIFPTYSVFKALKSHATVAITGDGGDELFGGYPSQFNQPFLHDVMAGELPFPLFISGIKGMRKLSAAFSKRVFLYRRMQACSISHTPFIKVIPFKLPVLKDRIDALKAENSSFVISGDLPLSEWFNHTKIGLTDRMLTKVDLCSMAAGVEARSPFLDEDLWNLVMQSDANLAVFKHQCPKNFISNYASDFKKVVKKQGFSADYRKIRSDLGLGSTGLIRRRFLANQDSAAISAKIISHWLKKNGYDSVNFEQNRHMSEAKKIVEFRPGERKN